MADINKAIREAQFQLIKDYINNCDDIKCAIEGHNPCTEKAIAKSIAKIKALVVESLGEDDTYNEMCEHCNNWDEGRNDLRGEIRSIFE